MHGLRARHLDWLPVGEKMNDPEIFHVDHLIGACLHIANRDFPEKDKAIGQVLESLVREVSRLRNMHWKVCEQCRGLGRIMWFSINPKEESECGKCKGKGEVRCDF